MTPFILLGVFCNEYLYHIWNEGKCKRNKFSSTFVWRRERIQTNEYFLPLQNWLAKNYTRVSFLAMCLVVSDLEWTLTHTHCPFFWGYIYEETFVRVGWRTVMMMIWSQTSHWNWMSGFKVILISIFSLKLDMNGQKIFYLILFVARVIICGFELNAKCFIADPAPFYKHKWFVRE